jgi:hypothetical protein
MRIIFLFFVILQQEKCINRSCIESKGANLPFDIRNVVSRSEAAENKSDRMTKTFFERISFITQCP